MCERLQYSWALTWLAYFLAIQVMGKEDGVRPADLSLMALDASYESHHPSYYPPMHADGSFIQSYPNRAILTTVTIACFKRESQEIEGSPISVQLTVGPANTLLWYLFQLSDRA